MVQIATTLPTEEASTADGMMIDIATLVTASMGIGTTEVESELQEPVSHLSFIPKRDRQNSKALPCSCNAGEKKKWETEQRRKFLNKGGTTGGWSHSRVGKWEFKPMLWVPPELTNGTDKQRCNELKAAMALAWVEKAHDPSAHCIAFDEKEKRKGSSAS